jgi:hypothetical protein
MRPKSANRKMTGARERLTIFKGLGLLDRRIVIGAMHDHDIQRRVPNSFTYARATPIPRPAPPDSGLHCGLGAAFYTPKKLQDIDVLSNLR